MLIDQGASPLTGDAWPLRRRDAAQRSPCRLTLTGVLQARLTACPPPSGPRCSRRASSAPVFWDRALAALDATAAAALPALVQPRAGAAARAQRGFAGFARVRLPATTCCTR